MHIAHSTCTCTAQCVREAVAPSSGVGHAGDARQRSCRWSVWRGAVGECTCAWGGRVGQPCCFGLTRSRYCTGTGGMLAHVQHRAGVQLSPLAEVSRARGPRVVGLRWVREKRSRWRGQCTCGHAQPPALGAWG